MDVVHSQNVRLLVRSLLVLQNEEEASAYLEDLMTSQELMSVSQRLNVAVMLSQGKKYDEVAEATGASSATISRVNRCIRYGRGGYQTVIDRLEEKEL